MAGLAVVNTCAVTFVNAQHIDWCVSYLVSSAISLVIYNYIATFPESREEKSSKTTPCKANFLALLFAGICGGGLTYQFHVVDTYITDVVILETAGKYVIYSPFWITLFLMFIPAAQVIKNLGALNTIFISLIGILASVGLLYIFHSLNYHILVTHQVIYAIFFSLLLSPSFAFIYQLLNGRNSYFCVNFIFHLGVVSFAGITVYISTLNFLPSPFLGASLIALLMSACLLIIYYSNPFAAESTI